MPASNPMRRRVLHRLPVAEDLEIHVSTVTIARAPYVEVRNFTPSLKVYGRGVIVPPSVAAQIGDALVEIARTDPQ